MPFYDAEETETIFSGWPSGMAGWLGWQFAADCDLLMK